MESYIILVKVSLFIDYLLGLEQALVMMINYQFHLQQ